uniref:Agouti-signaling protein n=1 Tax=Xenopus tropicalis TaxID=8364 RepID=J3A6D6_XENTR|nr:TPA: Agouti signaling peptide [Xenopus tropicalis]
MKGILLLLLTSLLVLVHSHIILEEKKEGTNSGSVIRFSELLPPISIVELTKTSRRVSRVDAEKNKLAKKPRPPPPPNCVPVLSSCKAPAAPCCEHCAICHCLLFQTVCYYKMGYPNC